MKKAIVIGSTGMVGTQLIDLLINSNEYSEIVSLVRRPSGITHPKLSEHPVDFDKIETWTRFVKGDVLFSCMGTTIAQAKTKEISIKLIIHTSTMWLKQLRQMEFRPTFCFVGRSKSKINRILFKNEGTTRRSGFKTSFQKYHHFTPGSIIRQPNRKTFG